MLSDAQMPGGGALGDEDEEDHYGDKRREEDAKEGTENESAAAIDDLGTSTPKKIVRNDQI